MKKLALALILALVLTVIFSTPVLADDGNGPGNMPEETADHLLDDVRGDGSWPLDGTLFNGWGNHPVKPSNPGKPRAGGAANVAQRAIYYIAHGETPPWTGKP